MTALFDDVTKYCLASEGGGKYLHLTFSWVMILILHSADSCDADESDYPPISLPLMGV